MVGNGCFFLFSSFFLVFLLRWLCFFVNCLHVVVVVVVVVAAVVVVAVVVVVVPFLLFPSCCGIHLFQESSEDSIKSSSLGLKPKRIGLQHVWGENVPPAPSSEVPSPESLATAPCKHKSLGRPAMR